MFSNISVVWNLIPSKFKPKFLLLFFYYIKLNTRNSWFRFKTSGTYYFG